MPTASSSQNGWPASPDPGSLNLTTLRLKLRNPKPRTADGLWDVTVAAEAAPSLEAMIRWWDENIEPVEALAGYGYREIRGKEGTNLVSNHGSGTAIDINWDKHPWKASGTIPSAKVAPLRAMAASLGLRWGGDYKGNIDEMHFEVPVSPSAWRQAAGTYEVAARAAGASGAGGGGGSFGWLVLFGLVGGGFVYARKKGYLRKIGQRYPKLRRLTGA